MIFLWSKLFADNKKVNLFLFAFLLNLIFFYSSIPFSFYLLILFLFLYSYVSKINIKAKISSSFYIYIFLLAIYLTAFLQSSWNLFYVKEIIYGIIILYIGILFNNIKIKFDKLANIFYKINISFGVIGSLLYIIAWVLAPQILSKLISDENFYAIAFLVSLVVILNKIRYSNAKKTLLLVLFFIVISSNIVLTFSRRANIVLIILILILVLTLFYKYFIISNKRKRNIIAFSVLTFLFLITINSIIKTYINKYPEKVIYSLENLSQFINYSDGSIALFYYLFNESSENLSKNDNLIVDYNKKAKIKVWATDIKTQKSIQGIHVYNDTDSTSYWGLYYIGRKINFYEKTLYELSFKIKIIDGDFNSFKIGFWLPKNSADYLNKMNLSLKKELKNNGWYKCHTTFRFFEDTNNAKFFLHSLSSNTKLIIDSITIKGLKGKIHPVYKDETNVLQLDKFKLHRIWKPRGIRWIFAYDIWNNEYNILEKTIGKGFIYNSYFGAKFQNNKNIIDYPHNPIISSFLYSGIIGGSFYLFFLIYGLVQYIKSYKHLKVLFLIYIICLFFCLFSSNSHFSVPIFNFLSLLPYFYAK